MSINKEISNYLDKLAIQDEGLLLLEKIREDIKNVGPEDFNSLTILVKIKGEYLKYTIGLADPILDIGQMEAIKYNVMKNMHK